MKAAVEQIKSNVKDKLEKASIDKTQKDGSTRQTRASVNAPQTPLVPAPTVPLPPQVPAPAAPSPPGPALGDHQDLATKGR